MCFKTIKPSWVFHSYATFTPPKFKSWSSKDISIINKDGTSQQKYNYCSFFKGKKLHPTLGTNRTYNSSINNKGNNKKIQVSTICPTQSHSQRIFRYHLQIFPSPSPRKHTRVLLLSSERPREATTQTASAISSLSCRHVCSAAYLFKPAAGPGGSVRASPGASPACLRIHSHLRIKLLTLMLLVMLGPTPIFEPINQQEQGNIGPAGERRRWQIQTRHRGSFVR